MIQEIRIDTIDKAMDLVKDQERNMRIDRLRSAYFYRGMASADFSLYTSLSRNCKDLQKKLEPAILSNFTKYAIKEDPTLSESIWKQMIIGQHHGLPTRLLDWTHSPLIALHFATSENNLDDLSARDGVVWRLDARDVNTNLPEKYRGELARRDSFVFSVDMLSQLADSLQGYDTDMDGKAFVMLEPPSVEQRVITQYSFFSVIPTEMENIENFLAQNTVKTCKFIIDKKIRWDLRDMLDQFNISERIIYPGLDGLSRWIGRHYYVK